MPLLNPGDPFPRLTISTTDDQTLTVPDAFAGDFGVVLFYRGAWCPFCNIEMHAMQKEIVEVARRVHYVITQKRLVGIARYIGEVVVVVCSE